ncbi:MAG: hypothetical protein WAO71_11490 [Gallionella sp.]
MTQHEQSVINVFDKFFEREARKKNIEVRSFSLDGQDVIAGADYILTDQSRFTLVEFKYTQNEIFAEADKPKRCKLCSQLEREPDMKSLHDQCHLIAWLHKPESEVKCNIYRLEVCNREIWGASCQPSAIKPSVEKRITVKQFTDDFFSSNSTHSLSLQEFETYVAWLHKIVGSSKCSFELLTHDFTLGKCGTLILPSIKAAHDWMQKQRPEPTNNSYNMS